MSVIVKTAFHYFRSSVLFLFFVVLHVVGMSQLTIGDFQSKQSGDWNDVNTWEQWNGFEWLTPRSNFGFPVVAGTSTSVNNGVTLHTVRLPDGVRADDLLIMLWTDNETNSTTLSGTDFTNWKIIYEDNTLGNKRAAYYKVAKGNEGTSISITTSAKESSVQNVYRIAAGTWQGTPESVGPITGSTAAPNPPLLDPVQWNSGPTLWVISDHISGDGNITITAPANYTSTLIRAGTGGGGGGGDAVMASAYRLINAGSEDPGAFTNAQSRSTSTATIAVRGKYIGDYPRTIFPVVASANSSAQTADTKIHNISLPSGIAKGDLLLIFYADKNAASTMTSTGWTALYDYVDAASSTMRRAAFFRIADGTEGVTVTFTTSANERSAHTSYRILAGTYQGVPISGMMATSSTDNSAPNPSVHNPGWGTKNILWIAASHSGGDDNSPPPIAPPNYINLVSGYTGNSGTGHARVVTAQRELTADSEDPDWFTLGSNVAWSANTVAIQGSGYATVLNNHVVTTTESVSVPGVTINAGGTVLLNDGVVFTTPQSGTFIVNGTLQTGIDGTAMHSGAGSFSLNSNATLWVSSADGVTKSSALGNVQTGGTRTYHPRANYRYNGILDQETGDALITANHFYVGGGSNKVLTQDLTIYGKLDLISGDLNSGHNILTIANGGDIVGYKDESLIIGTLKRIGTGPSPYNVVFPLAGNKHKYLQPVTITYSASSDVDEFTITHIDNKHPMNDQKTTAIGLMSDREYWDVIPSEATRQRIQNGSQQITLNIAYKSDDVKYIPERSKELYLLGHFNSTSALWEPASVDATILRDGTDASGTVTMYNVKNFSPFAIASTNGTNPVMLTNFDVQTTSDKKIKLAWTTDAESINKGFGIERRIGDGDKFEQIGFVNSLAHGGNSAVKLYYTFLDHDPIRKAHSYYRLAQLDLDGKISYSEVKLLRFGELQKSLIYPNPSSGSITITRPDSMISMNVSIYHSSGKLIREYNGITESSLRLHIDHPGLYSILIVGPSGDLQATQWVVIR